MIILIKQAATDFSEYGDWYEYGYGLGSDKPPTSAIYKKENLRKIFYIMSPDEDSTLSAMLIKPVPLVFQAAKFDYGDHVDKVRHVYIKTTHDNVVNLSQQEAMVIYLVCCSKP